MEEAVLGASADANLVVIVRFGFRAPTNALANHDEEQNKKENAGNEDDDSDHFLQADVPGGGDKFVVYFGMEFTMRATVTIGAVTAEGAVCVLAAAAIATRVLQTLVYVTETPAHKQNKQTYTDQ